MLFGVPNQGTEIATGASKILNLLSVVFRMNMNVVVELQSKSQTLASIASEFRQIRNERNIPVISFFETKRYSTSLGLVSIAISYWCNPHVSALGNDIHLPPSALIPLAFGWACQIFADRADCEQGISRH